MKISLSFVSILVVAASTAVVACNAPGKDEGAEPSGTEPEATTPGDGFHSRETIIAGFAAGDVEHAIDHQWDDKVVPANDLDEPDNHFDPSESDKSPGPTPVAPVAAPNTIDLRAYAKIINQTNEGSCTAYATVGAMQVMATAGGQKDDMSAQHLWNLQGKKPNTAASLNTAMQKYIAPLSIWPNGGYSKATVSDPNSYGFARLKQAANIPQGLSNVVNALAKGKPVVMASTLNDSWRYMNSKGIINPKAAATGNWVHAAHAYDLVGYVNDASVEDGGYFIVKNSWGTGWGDKGYAYMPYSYCKHQKARPNGYCLFYSVDGVEVKGSTPNPSPNPSPSPTPTNQYAVKVTFGELDGSNQDFQLSIAATAGALANVDHVVYDIHPTFGSAAVATSYSAASAFATVTYSTYASGWSTQGTKVVLKGGQTIPLAGTAIKWK
jgi:hypothetical protein